ncbi:hypothetical protein MUP59_01970, partial [Candidatus Bathyarchaeota archaeon]|nr:hypothetical protein [Candidatus Bathyarchaeota archaeon]
PWLELAKELGFKCKICGTTEDLPWLELAKELGFKCKICGTTEDLLRHHISYQPEVVEILCQRCHKMRHIYKGASISVNGEKPLPYTITPYEGSLGKVKP